MASVFDLKKFFQRCDTRIQDEYPVHIPEGLARASILIPLFFRKDEWRVILTLRSQNLTFHSGVVSFPGGHQEIGDKDEVETALREAEEEIGLKSKDVTIIAKLPKSFIAPNVVVTPVLGIIPAEFTPCVNTREVQMTFDLSLSRFVADDRIMIPSYFQEELFYIPQFNDVIEGKEVVTYGYTAMGCILVALVVLQSETRIELRRGVIVTKHTAFDIKSSHQHLQKVILTFISSRL